METTLLKSKMPKKILFKIGSVILILIACVLFFFTNNKTLEFIQKYFENSSVLNVVIIALIFLTPLFGFLIPYNKPSKEGQSLTSINNKRRTIENRRKKVLMRLMNANNKHA